MLAELSRGEKQSICMNALSESFCTWSVHYKQVNNPLGNKLGVIAVLTE